jgi:hypothetical protein
MLCGGRRRLSIATVPDDVWQLKPVAVTAYGSEVIA